MQLVEFKLLPRRLDTPTPNIKEFERAYIGEGSFGKVYSAVHLHSSRQYALKEISKFHGECHIPKEIGELEQVNHEMEIMYSLDSPYIVKMYDHFDDAENIYLLLELVHGIQLYNGVIRRKITIQQSLIAKIVTQLCLALRHIHSRGVIHRDVKPENIMLTKQLNIKLIDFGTANYTGPQHIRKTKTGSLPYFAPEIVQKKAHNQAVDVWCVGILMYQLHFHKTPFQDINNTESNILRNRIKLPDTMDTDAKDLITRILVKDSSKRITLQQILIHPWIRSKTQPRQKHLICGVEFNIDNEIIKQLAENMATETPRAKKSVSPVPKQNFGKKIIKPPVKAQENKSNLSKDSDTSDISGHMVPQSSKLKVKINTSVLNNSEHKSVLKNNTNKSTSNVTPRTYSPSAKHRMELQKKLNSILAQNQKLATEVGKQAKIVQSNNRKISELNCQIQQYRQFKMQHQGIKKKISQSQTQLQQAQEINKSLKTKQSILDLEYKALFVARRHDNSNSQKQQNLSSMKQTPRSNHSKTLTALEFSNLPPKTTHLTTPKNRTKLFSELSANYATPKQFQTGTTSTPRMLNQNQKYATMDRSNTTADLNNYLTHLKDRRLMDPDISSRL